MDHTTLSPYTPLRKLDVHCPVPCVLRQLQPRPPEKKAMKTLLQLSVSNNKENMDMEFII